MSFFCAVEKMGLKQKNMSNISGLKSMILDVGYDTKIHFFEKKVQNILVVKKFALYLHSQSGTKPIQTMPE